RRSLRKTPWLGCIAGGSPVVSRSVGDSPLGRTPVEPQTAEGVHPGIDPVPGAAYRQVTTAGARRHGALPPGACSGGVAPRGEKTPEGEVDPVNGNGPRPVVASHLRVTAPACPWEWRAMHHSRGVSPLRLRF